ncbi:MAG: RluA family pseudouridine synthase [Alphaproteobacteria bacterium]
MSSVEIREVGPEDDDVRLDHWFKRHFPMIGYGRLQKLLRTGQVRVEGRRAKPGLRLATGQSVRVPPLDTGPDSAAPRPPRRALELSDRDAEFARSLVIFRDDDVLAINKPAGLAVQGGTGTLRHIDGMLDALQFDAAERPRLVHRLDRDTSGVMLLARNRKAAAALGKSFQGRDARKIYWALVMGVPRPERGKVDLAIGKTPGRMGERVSPDAEDAKRAVTLYRVLERSANRLSWVAFWPQTGRTHQIRVHATAMGHPVLGDGKYGGADAFLPTDEVARQLHLHAREIRLQHPTRHGFIHVAADLPPHMRDTWTMFDFSSGFPGDPFEEIE